MSQYLIEQLDLIKNQIIANYQPEKILLFGSVVKGEFHEGSDFDLLVIKNTDDHPIRRAQKLYAMVDRKVACDFIVFTPREIKERKKMGDYFINDILNSGKILYEK